MILRCRRLLSGEKEITFCFAICFSSQITQNSQKFAAAEIEIKMNLLFAKFTKGILEFLESGRKCWTLDARPWTLDAGQWMLNATLWTLGSGHWTLSLTVLKQNQKPVSDSASLNY